MSSCPRCHSSQSVSGQLDLSGTDSGCPTYFAPDGLRFLTIRKAVSLTHGQAFHACLSCGLTWSELDPSELNALLLKNGTENTRLGLQAGQGVVDE